MKALWLVAALGAAALPALAETTVDGAWIRGTVAQQKATGFFARITSSTGGRLVGASTPVAGIAEVHEMAMEGNVMHMRALPDGLELPAGKSVALAPGGVHVMLLDLKRPLGAGESVPMTLIVEHADKTRETIRLDVPVRPLGP